MSYTASKLVEIALAEVGYLEKKSNAQLDDKTANAGYNNWTKYARDLNDADYYNGNKNGFAWCDVFVDWCFYMLCGKNAKEGQRLICQTGELGAACGYSANYYKNQGRFYSSNPKPGDQIFFWNSAKSAVAHTGIVKAVDSTYVYTIEGNTSSSSGVVANGGGVFEKKYELSYYRIYGYGRPRYDEDAAGSAEAQPENKTEEVSTVNIELNVLKKGMNGEQVKSLQRILYAMCYSLGSRNPIDGDFGSKTDAAVKAYQEKNGLEVDGIVGAMTWRSLLGVS